MRRRQAEPRIALRPDEDNATDPLAALGDVYVKDVSMFRAELMDHDWMWVGCYLNGVDEPHDRICFHIQAVKVKGKKRPRIAFYVSEYPQDGSVTYEPRGLNGRHS